MNPLTIGVQNGFKPDPRLTVTEWSDKYRILTSEASAEAGRWRTDRTPYLREIMDVMSPTSPVQQVKVIKGTQLGFSSIADNIAMCYLDFYPCPILYILPTETLAKGTSKRRITPSIRAIPHLAKKVLGGKSKADVGETFTKQVSGGNLTLGWSNSTASFRSFSARVVMLDDCDGFGSFGEGDVIELGKARADAFANKKIYINSTPTMEGVSNIAPEFEDSDQCEYEMPCPECDKLMGFKWEYMQYERNEKGHLIGDVTCTCPNCGTAVPEYKKTTMMAKGKWIPKNEGHHHKGYKLTSFYSPLGWLSWNEITREFIKAYKLMGDGDNRAMQVWVNTRNAEVWKNALDGVEISNPHERVEEYGAEVPNEVFVITCGIDTQDDRYELEVLGHGRNGETYSIDYKVIAGDPNFPETNRMLDEYLDTEFTRVDGFTMKIIGSAVDTGGHRTKAVYDFCKPRQHTKHVFAIKGANQPNSPIVNKRYGGRNSNNELVLYMVGVNTIKDDFYANLSVAVEGANYCHFPNKDIYNDKYFKMLTAEKRDQKGKYVKVRLRNEALDVRVYALAVLGILGIDVNKLHKPFLHIGEVTPQPVQQNINQTHNNVNSNFTSYSSHLDEF